MADDMFLAELAEMVGAEPGTLTAESSLEELQWDSLAVVGCIAAIDDHYSVTVNGEALGNCGTVGEILGLVHAKTGGHA